MAFHDVLQDIPNDGFLAIHDLLGALDGLDDAALDELADDEGLVELGGHQLGNAALVHLQLRTYHDHGTGRVVDTLAEQVLAEAALLALEAVGQRLERAVDVALDGGCLAGIVEQAVYGLLEQTLLVAQDDLRGLDLHQSLQAVVADDDATVEVVEVGGGEAATVQGHERAQFGRNHRHGTQYHPLGLVDVARGSEALHHLQALESLGLALLAAVGIGTVAQLIRELVQVDVAQQVEDGLGAHLGYELVGIVVGQVLVLLAQLVHDLQIFLLGKQVELVDDIELAGLGQTLLFGSALGKFLALAGLAGLDHHVALVINHGVELLAGQTQQVADLVGQGAEVPDVCHRHQQLDMAHALAAHLLLGHLHATVVAVTLVVLDRAEDLLAEQAVAFGLIGAVVDGLGLEDLTARTGLDLLGRCQRDGDLGEVRLYLVVFLESHLCSFLP